MFLGKKLFDYGEKYWSVTAELHKSVVPIGNI